MRIVLDTNVIVSALVFGGLPRRLFELVENGYHEFFYSATIQEECSRVLRAKFDWDRAALDRYLSTIWALGTRVAPRTRVRAILEDPDDDRILECAVAARADAIVSGDRHLVRLEKYGVIAIVTPRQFLDEHGRDVM